MQEYEIRYPSDNIAHPWSRHFRNELMVTPQSFLSVNFLKQISNISCFDLSFSSPDWFYLPVPTFLPKLLSNQCITVQTHPWETSRPTNFLLKIVPYCFNIPAKFHCFDFFIFGTHSLKFGVELSLGLHLNWTLSFGANLLSKSKLI